MSNIINEITLNCLVNKFQLEKLTSKRRNDVVQNDAQVFKKELLQLFNDLLDNNPPTNILPCVNRSFSYYIEQCICYLKLQNSSHHENETESSLQTNNDVNNECDDEDCGDDFNYDDNIE